MNLLIMRAGALIIVTTVNHMMTHDDAAITHNVRNVMLADDGLECLSNAANNAWTYIDRYIHLQMACCDCCGHVL